MHNEANTGEHLTKERFEELHNSTTPRTVLIFSNSQEVLDEVIPHPLVMIASDGFPGHPRHAGSSAKILGHYVREKKSLTLAQAIDKLSLMPAPGLLAQAPSGCSDRAGEVAIWPPLDRALDRPLDH